MPKFGVDLRDLLPHLLRADFITLIEGQAEGLDQVRPVGGQFPLFVARDVWSEVGFLGQVPSLTALRHPQTAVLLRAGRADARNRRATGQGHNVDASGVEVDPFLGQRPDADAVFLSDGTNDVERGRLLHPLRAGQVLGHAASRPSDSSGNS